METFCTRIGDGAWNESLERNNYTHLKITEIDRLQQMPNATRRVQELEELNAGSRLYGITSLKMALSLSQDNHRVDFLAVWPLTQMFLSLREVDLSYMRMLTIQHGGSETLCFDFCSCCPDLK